MVAAAVTAIHPPLVQSSATTFRQLPANDVKNALRIRRKSFAFEPCVSTSSFSYGGRRFIVAASKSPNEEANSVADDSGFSFTSQDDLNFLLKLGLGSFTGAAAIKYGSILVPAITQPNITQALAMVFTPVLAAVLILIKESRTEQ